MRLIVTICLATVLFATPHTALASRGCDATAYRPSEHIRELDRLVRQQVQVGMTRAEVKAAMQEAAPKARYSAGGAGEDDTYSIDDKTWLSVTFSTAIFHLTYDGDGRLTAICTTYVNTGP